MFTKASTKLDTNYERRWRRRTSNNYRLIYGDLRLYNYISHRLHRLINNGSIAVYSGGSLGIAGFGLGVDGEVVRISLSKRDYTRVISISLASGLEEP